MSRFLHALGSSILAACMTDAPQGPLPGGVSSVPYQAPAMTNHQPASQEEIMRARQAALAALGRNAEGVIALTDGAPAVIHCESAPTAGDAFLKAVVGGAIRLERIVGHPVSVPEVLTEGKMLPNGDAMECVVVAETSTR